MKTTKILGLGLLLALASGCASTFTSIEKEGDNTYYVTSVEQGFFKVGGTLYKCEGDGKRLVCTELDAR